MADRKDGRHGEAVPENNICYCAYCETARCPSIIKLLGIMYPDIRVIYPRHIRHSWSKGSMTDTEQALTPGYIFLYMPADYSKAETEAAIERIRGTDRPTGLLFFLRYRDGSHELTGSDRDFALMLLQKDGVIGKTEVRLEGSLIRVKEGAFAGLETEVLKVDRRNGRMQIKIPFAGREIKTWVEYEITEIIEQAE